MKNKNGYTGWGHVIFTCFVVFCWFIVSLIMGHRVWWSQMIAYSVCLGLFLYAIYGLVARFLAENDLLFSKINEATAAIFSRGGQLDHVKISYDGHYLDEDYNVKAIPLPKKKKKKEEEGEEEEKKKKKKKKFWGGIHFFGIPPLMERMVYRFKWSHRHADGTVKDHSEDISHVLLVPDFYVQKYKIDTESGLEDVNGFGIGAFLILPMQIVNPVEAILRVKDFLVAIFSLVDPAVVNFVAFFRGKEDLTGMKVGAFDDDDAKKNKLEDKWESIEVLKDIKPGSELRDILWKFITDILEKDAPPNKFFLEKDKDGNVISIIIYGVRIIKNGTTLTNIELPKTMQAAATAQYLAEAEGLAEVTKAEMSAKVAVIKATAEGDAFKERVSTPVMRIACSLAAVSTEADNLTTDQVLEVGKKLPEAWQQYKQTLSIEKLGEQASIVVLPSGQNLGQAIAGGADDAIIREIIRQELSKNVLP